MEEKYAMLEQVKSSLTKAAKPLTTLVVILGLAAFVFPANTLAARPLPAQAPGILTIHVSNYPHGFNLQGVAVVATSPDGANPYTAITNYEGLAKMEVPAGYYNVTLLHRNAGYEPWSQTINVIANQTTLVEAQVTLTSEMTNFSLNVLDAASKARVADAAVSVYDAKGKVVAKGITNAKGIFAARIPMGTYISTIEHPKYEAHKDFVKTVPGQANEATMALAPLGASSMGDMQIHALDGNTYAPIEGAQVYLYDAYGTLLDQGMADKVGTYYTCLPEGKYWVVIKAPMYATYSSAHMITADTLTHYKVLLWSIMAK